MFEKAVSNVNILVANVNIFSKHNKSTRNEQGGAKTIRMNSDMFLGAEFRL